MEDLEFVDVSVADLIATVTLRRPPVNALSAPMMREITRVFTALSRGTSAAVAILTASGNRLFYAGATSASPTGVTTAGSCCRRRAWPTWSTRVRWCGTASSRSRAARCR